MTAKEKRLLKLIADNGGGMSHDETSLDPFSGDNGNRVDTFNRCSALGWIRSTHNNDTSESLVYITQLGRDALSACELNELPL